MLICAYNKEVSGYTRARYLKLPGEISHCNWRRGEALIMATHGTLGEFNSTRKDWVSYTERRLVQYFGQTAFRKRAINGEPSSSALDLTKMWCCHIPINS